MTKLLISFYHFFQQKKNTLYLLLASIILLLSFGVSRLTIEDDFTKMMPNAGKASDILQTLEDSRISEKIAFLVHAKNENVSNETLIEAAENLNARLADSLAAFTEKVKYQANDDDFMQLRSLILQNIPLFLEAEDYPQIDSLVALHNIPSALENDYKALASASGFVVKDQILNDPLGISNLAMKKLNRLHFNENIVLQDGYFFTKDLSNVLLVLTPSFSSRDSKQNADFVPQLNTQIAALEKEFPDCKIIYYGASPVAHGNAEQSKNDTILTISITLIGLLSFIWFYFRKKHVPIVVLLPVVFGVLFSLCMVGLTQGTISLIALGAGAVVLGISVNFSLHFINHYKHSGSIEETISDLIEPFTIGSFTTVASFFSLSFVQSPILNDFGVFAAWTIIGTALFTLVFLPHFVPKFSHETSILEKIASKEYKPNKWIAIGICALTVLFLFFVNDVQFDSDLNQLNFQTAELKANEKAINALQGENVKTVYIASKGETLADALNANATLTETLRKNEQDSSILSYASIAPFVMTHAEQQARINRWNAYWNGEKKRAVVDAVKENAPNHHFKIQAFQPFYDLMENAPQPLSEENTSFLSKAIGAEQIAKTDSGYTILSSILLLKDKRETVYPEIEKETSATILDKSIVTNSLIDFIYTDFNHILLYTSLIVFFALVMSYGRIELALITFIPMLITWIWILGIMGLFGLKFNIVNIVISTFIFGLGDDFSIFITDGLTRKFKEGKNILASHKSSIFLASVTTIFGLGTLIFAQHPALKSIAWLSMLGLACVIIIGQTIQPMLYNFFIQNRKEKGFAPWTLPTVLLAVWAFSYFVIGGFLLAGIGFFILYVLPFPSKEKRKYAYHYLFSKFVKSLVYMMANTKKVHINRELADFSKPAVIISNHQSFLDILVTVMQHPKIILLTNEWVYNSPFFGRVVQLGDYYPVTEEGTDGIDRLRKKVSEGYSIVVFPEGTRSPKEGNMKRFKKGAFYIAEQLGLDIQPLVLHGIGHTMGKSDFMLYNGQMTMKYLPRISPSDTRFGVGYSERAKQIGAYFKEEYEKLRSEIEQPTYFKQKLEMNYVYKGPVLEWYTWKKIQLENYYKTYHEVLPRSGNITDLGCGYGYMAYMLHFLCPQRNITGVDYDEDKIAVANNNFSRTESLNFFAQSITQYPFVPQDAFVINDVLHYLKYEEQETVLKNCIDNLNAGGIIIVKDANAEDQKGQRVTWLSEFFSTNFGFNKMGHGELFFTSESRLRAIADKYNMAFSILEAPKHSSNTIWALRRK